MGTRVADLLVETLQAAGVRTCCGIVGDTMNRIAHAIDRSRIDWVHMRHEEAGAFAAAAEASLTGRLTACAGSCGAGSCRICNAWLRSHADANDPAGKVECNPNLIFWARLYPRSPPGSYARWQYLFQSTHC